MKKILMRCAMNPFEIIEPTEQIIHNHMGGNLGNWVYSHAAAKTVMVDDDTIIDTVNVKKTAFTDEYIDYINSTYDCFLLPMSNAFRSSFISELRKLTGIINRLTIPVYVIGIGIQIGIGTPFNTTYQYHDEAKAFIKAVLNKSAMIGVRGEITADFCKKLGFIEDTDYTVIGCPSMYYNGIELPKQKPIGLNPGSVISLNSKIEWEERNPGYLSFMQKCIKDYDNYIYIPQHISDIRRMYFNHSEPYKNAPANKLYRDDHTVTFLSLYDWITYMHDYTDLTVGTRIHGSIVSILAGVPSVIFPPDQRVQELARYHKIPAFDILSANGNTSLLSFVEKADFAAMYNVQKENFCRYVDFLNKIGIEHIYKDDIYRTECPFDKKISSMKLSGAIKAYVNITVEEQNDRLHNAYAILRDDKYNFAEKNKINKDKINELNKKIASLKKEVKEKKRYEKTVFFRIYNQLRRIKRELMRRCKNLT